MVSSQTTGDLTEKSLTRTCGPKPPYFYGKFIISVSKLCFNDFQIQKVGVLVLGAVPKMFDVLIPISTALRGAHGRLLFDTRSHHDLLVKFSVCYWKWHIERVDLSNLKMVICHFTKLWVITRGYHRMILLKTDSDIIHGRTPAGMNPLWSQRIISR